MKRFFTITGLLVAVLAVGYFAGPTAHPDAVKDETIMLDPDLVKLEKSIAESESKANLRFDNEARIVWADSLRKVKTPYSIVYLPGFSATWAEGDPIHKQIARHFGCNLYLARTAEHGVDSPRCTERYNATPTTLPPPNARWRLVNHWVIKLLSWAHRQEGCSRFIWLLTTPKLMD